MYLLILFSSFMNVGSVSFQTDHLMNILERKYNTFHSVNENVHKMINKVFSLLKLKSDFLKSTNIHLMLIMHSDLNNIAVKNFNVYKKLRNITKTGTYTSHLELSDVVDQIMKECSKGNETKMGEIKTDNITVKASSSIESLDFLEDFVKKINRSVVDDFIMEALNNETDIFKLDNYIKENLKLWHPSTQQENEELFNNLPNRRIYKGKKTRIKKYPFMASVHVMNEFMCASSIISKDLVITAASCLQIAYNKKKLRQKPTSIFIRVGSDYTKRFGETIPIKELYFHPQYEPFNLKNNLVLLRMAKQLKFLNKKRKIRRIQFDKIASRLQDVDEVTILGWGATDNVLGVKTYQPLAVADIDVYDFAKCQEIYSANYVTDTNFCVGFTTKGGGACNKAVGGPAVVNGVLIGVISFGPPVCGTPDMPTVLVKLGFYARWIESIIKQKSFTTKLTKFKTSAQLTTEKEEYPTTSTKEIDEVYPQNPNYARTGMKQDYPEEVVILNQILNDVILSNNSILDNILYGALEEDFSDIFKSTTKEQLHHHPLVNKSLFLLPNIHDFGKEPQLNVTVDLTTSSPILTTTHPGLNIHYVDDYGERIRYLEHAYHLHSEFMPPATRTHSTTEEPWHITDRYGRTRSISVLELADTENEYSKVVSSDDSEKLSDNYEARSKDVEEESKGLSIDAEVPRQGEGFLSTKLNIDKLNTENIFIHRTKDEPDPKAKTNFVLKQPQPLKVLSKFTRLINRNQVYTHDEENSQRKTKNRKNKLRFRFQ